MIDNRNRAFHYAVLGSLVLHALLLFAFPELIDTARRAASIPPQIIARLMEPEPAAPPPAPAQAPPAVPIKKPAPPQVVKPVPEPAAKPEPAASPEPAPLPAKPAVSEPETMSPPVASVSPAPVLVAPRTEAAESLSRDQYRLELMAAAAHHARTRYPPRGYPPLARENNWEGDVRVGVAVRANGRASITLKESSGYEALDRQALDSFRQAARAVALPQALRGKDFDLDVRATYRLED